MTTTKDTKRTHIVSSLFTRRHSLCKPTDHKPIPLEGRMHAIEFYRSRFRTCREQGYTVEGIAKRYGMHTQHILDILQGRIPEGVEFSISVLRQEALRLLERPRRETLQRTFKGDIEAYRRCVFCNFADVLAESDLER